MPKGVSRSVMVLGAADRLSFPIPTKQDIRAVNEVFAPAVKRILCSNAQVPGSRSGRSACLMSNEEAIRSVLRRFTAPCLMFSSQTGGDRCRGRRSVIHGRWKHGQYFKVIRMRSDVLIGRERAPACGYGDVEKGYGSWYT